MTRDHSRHLIVALAVFLMPGPVACGPKHDAVFPSFEVFGPNDRPDLSTPVGPRKARIDAERIQLTAAVNETVSFQLVLRVPDVSCAGIDLHAEDFVYQSDLQTAPSARPDTAWEPPRVSLYRAWPVTVERYPNWFLRLVGPREPRCFFDALIPVAAPYHGRPFTITPGEPLVLWGDVQVPPHGRPGQYRSGLLVRGPWKDPRRLPIELTVYDVYLHPRDLLPALADVTLGPIIEAHGRTDPRNLRAALNDDEDARRAIQAAMELLHDHGLSPSTREIYPRLNQESDGRVIVDWTDYDRLCAPWIDGTAFEDARPAAAWPMPVDLRQPLPVRYDGLHSDSYAYILREYVDAIRRHFADRGWARRAWVWFDLARGPNPTPEELKQFRRLCALLRASEQRTAADRRETSTMPTTTAAASMPASLSAQEIPLRIVSTLIPQSMTPFGWKDYREVDVSGRIDVWVTPVRYFHRATMTSQQTHGRQVWLPSGHPPFGASLAVEAPPTQARALAWLAFIAQADALWIEQATDWPTRLFDATLDESVDRSDTWLLYPGTLFGLHEPIASVRLKQLRAGLQDVQLLRLLAAHGRQETANLLARSLIKAFGTEAYGDHCLDGVFGRWINAGERWQAARELLLEEAAMAVCETGGAPVNREANRAKWKTFLDATRRLELTPESTRVTAIHRADPADGADSTRRRLTITHELAVRSDLRISVQGELRLGPLPTGGRAVRGVVTFGPLDELELARRPLSWTLDGPLPCDLDGHFLQRVIVDAGDHGEIHADAVLSLVTAPTALRPIRVDGDLSDWSPAESNAAGDFRRFTFAASSDQAAGGGAEIPAAAHRPRAEYPTILYFCRDDEFLYVGLHAAAPTPAISDALTVRSEVDYEDMMPVGEDMVELLLDPTNAALRIDDLYHLVIKANGVGLFEKGIDLKPKIGSRVVWPGDPPRHAVTRTSYGWSAEIAIPVRAFGPAGDNAVWGLNVARNEPTRGEYSDWARAPRNCYDPRALGNLLMEP